MSDPITFEKRIASGADDLEQSASGSMSLTSSDFELVDDGSSIGQKVDLRFTGIDIPQSAAITAAVTGTALPPLAVTRLSVSFSFCSVEIPPTSRESKDVS
jgi:hypothetical protein